MLTYSSLDLIMDLYESDQTTLIASDDDSGPGANPQLSISLSAATTYYVKIAGYSGGVTGNYTIEAAGPASIQVPILEQLNTSSSISDSSKLSNRRIVWDYGDGTSAEAMTGRKAYTQPGRYKVTCYLYDREGNSYYDTFVQNVDVLNYVPDFITLSASNIQQYSLTAGRMNDPILVSRSTSWQYYNGDEDKSISIVTYISGSQSPDYFNLTDKHYAHLLPSHSTYLLLTGSNNETEFVEVSSFNIEGSSVYVKLSNNIIYIIYICNISYNLPTIFSSTDDLPAD
jgi:hypothetical protein